MRKVVFDIETKNTFQDVGKVDPALLDISVVGIYDSAQDTYTAFLEADFPALWGILEQTDLLIGYNSDHFDIPLLNKYYPGNLTHIKSIDLLKEIRGATGRRMRLDAVAEGTLGEKKSGHGLEAIGWWKAGEVDKVKEYCLHDVRLTKELYDYALKHGALKYKDLNSLRDVKLDTSSWESKEDSSSMTHTLPF